MTGRHVEISDATERLSVYAEQVDGDGPIIVTRNGTPIAAVIAVPNSDAETVALSQNPQVLAIIKRSRARQAHEGVVTTPRAGWAEAAERMHERGDDGLVDQVTPTVFDETEWEW